MTTSIARWKRGKAKTCTEYAARKTTAAMASGHSVRFSKRSSFGDGAVGPRKMFVIAARARRVRASTCSSATDDSDVTGPPWTIGS